MKERLGKLILATLLIVNLAMYGVPYHTLAEEQQESLSSTFSVIANSIHTNSEAVAEEPIISPKIDIHSSRTIRVIVQLRNQPIAVGEYSSSIGIHSFDAESSEKAIDKQQSSFLSKANNLGLDIEVHYQFDTVLNGMEISIPASQIPLLAELTEVKSIYENRVYYSIPVLTPEANTTADSVVRYDVTPLKQIGVPELWADGLTGAGLKVGVIDSGVDYLHPDLAAAYRGGWDSFHNDNDPYEDFPYSGNNGTYHGTHVSGTISGQGENPTSEVVQKGVAYGAELYAYKVLGSNPVTGGATGSSAQVIDGIERAVKDGMDVINLSLGSDDEKDPNSPDAIAINNAVLAGVVAVVANGNAADDGQYYYSMGSPASSQLAISVGAATSDKYDYSSETTSSLAADSFTLKLIQWQIGHEDFDSYFGNDPIDGVYVGLGRSEDYANVDVTGKVALISRGSNTFADKFHQAMQHGAKAVVIFNGNAKVVNGVTVPDLDYIGRDGYIGNHYGEEFNTIPIFDMEGIKGRALAKAVMSDPSTPLQFSFNISKSVVPGDGMASFSSRGPMSDGNFSIKPNFVAPGVSIFSTMPAFGVVNPNANYQEAYQRLSGTSMATPHVAGLVLLLKQAHPDWTPFDIRAALANTADRLAYNPVTSYDVYSQGAGRVNVARAVKTPAVLQTVEQLTILDKNLQPKNVTNFGDNFSFGMMEAGAQPKTQPLQVKNFSQDTITYSASIEMHPSVTTDPNPAKSIPTPDVQNIVATLSENSITIQGGSTESFTLALAPNSAAQDGVYEGRVILEHPDHPTLHLPFVVHVGERDENNRLGIQDVTLSKNVIITNGVEADRRTNVSFYLNSDEFNYLALNVYGLDDEFIGTLREVYTRDDNGDFVSISRGLQEIVDIDHSYTDMMGDSGHYLMDGIYKLEVMTAKLNRNGVPLPDSNGQTIHVAYKSFGVSTLDGEVIKVMQAKDQFQASVSNTTILNQPVLTLPTAPEGITFEVTNSSQPNYIGNNGVLLSRPQSGSVTVDLTVTIASVANPSVYIHTVVQATLNAPSSPSGGNNNGGGGGTMPSIPNPVPKGIDATTKAVMTQGQLSSTINVKTQTAGEKVAGTVTDADVQAALQAAGNSRMALVLKVPAMGSQVAEATLSSRQVDLLSEAKEGSTIIVGTSYSSVALPVSVLKSVPEQSDVRVTIQYASEESSVFTTQKPGSQVLATPVSFEVDVVSGNQRYPIAVSNKDFIKRSFKLDAKVDPTTAGVLFSKDGKVYPVAGTFTANEDDDSQIVTINRPGFSTYAVVGQAVDFTDIHTSFAKSQIQKLAHKFLISGKSASMFDPKANVTRAEFASMLTRSLGLHSTGAAPFKDVSASDWFANDVAAVYEAGLVKGAGNGNYNPHAPISRQELAIILSNASELIKMPVRKAPSHQAYSDTQRFAAYAKDSIAFVTENGLMTGKSANGTILFDPTAPTTREAAASVLCRLLQNGNLID
ncbi:S8 family serine peptidase [Ammoniphilus sp. YIM 78166]|uniref:S8 family serine peptidase n=1 Tax=Ammoniphilus sp. YIM 78166 TaxID=1644106 RepID=UPI0010701F61|nr:S8 family serine peptidase [Ammoniphilus sp. YIM 78166]